MFYLTSKFHDNRVNTFGFMEGGLLKPPLPPGPGTPKKPRRNRVKAHANGRNIVGRQHAKLLGPTCCAVCVEPQQCWHLLVLVGCSLKPLKLLDPYKRTQPCWPTTHNDVACDLLRPFAWAFITTVSLLYASSA